MKELEETKKILSDGEEIKEYFKPNKKRFVVINAIMSSIFTILFAGFFLSMGIDGLIHPDHFTTTDETTGVTSPDPVGPIVMTIIGGMALLAVIIVVVSLIVRYKRTLYVVTNRRLIVRSGFIGVDYKSIELKYVGLVNVRVDFLDKLVRSNTGTITFASATIPMVNAQGNPNGAFTFKCIDDPYEAYKKS